MIPDPGVVSSRILGERARRADDETGLARTGIPEEAARVTFHIARQPIHDRDLRVVGYELLFRDGVHDCYPEIDPHDATSRVVLEGGVTSGLGALTDGLPAFLNCSRESLLSGVAKALPAALTVVEILEDIEPDDEILAACRELRSLGYRIALDDFVYSPRFAPLLALADIVKLEVNTTSPEERHILLRHSSLQFVAEKVETAEELTTSLTEGFHFFQGYHLGRPELLERPRHETNHLHELVGTHLCRAQADTAYLCHLIRLDDGLSESLRSFCEARGTTFPRADTEIEILFGALDREGRQRWGEMLLAESSRAAGDARGKRNSRAA